MPHDLPPWQSVYYYFRQWTKSGRWEQLNSTLREQVRRKAGRNPEPSAAAIDSQSVKTTEEAAADTRGYDSGKHIKGRKRHLLVDTIGLVMKVVTLAANIQDRDGAQTLFARFAGALPACKRSGRMARMQVPNWAIGLKRNVPGYSRSSNARMMLRVLS